MRAENVQTLPKGKNCVAKSMDQHSPQISVHERLYFYPGYGYFDRPLYISHAANGTPVAVGYGSRRAGVEHHNQVHLPHAAPLSRSVAVYNGADILGKLPLKVLRRFSAAIVYSSSPKSLRCGQHQRDWQPTIKHSERKDSRVNVNSLSTEFTSCTDPNKDDSTEANQGLGKSSSCSAEGIVSIPFTVGISSPVATDQELALSSQCDDLILKLDLDVPKRPGNEYVGLIIKWMEENSTTLRIDEATEFGPENVDHLPLTVLLCYYQAALAFRLLQPPHKITTEILARLSYGAPSPEIFQFLLERLPLQDVVMTRGVVQIEHWRWTESCYTRSELEEINSLISENEKLKIRFEEMEGARFYNARQDACDTKLEKTGSQELNSICDCTKNCRSSVSSNGPSQVQPCRPEPGDVPTKTRRRRNRRLQQARYSAYHEAGEHLDVLSTVTQDYAENGPW